MLIIGNLDARRLPRRAARRAGRGGRGLGGAGRGGAEEDPGVRSGRRGGALAGRVPADPGAPHRRRRRRRGRHHRPSHLGNLEKKNYQAIARDLKQPLEEIYEAAKVIMDFDPKPGRQYTSDEPHLHHARRLHPQGRRQVLRRRQRRRPAQAQDLRLLPHGAGPGAQGARVHPGQAAQRAVADPVDPAAAAHHRQGHRVDPEVPARVLRQGHRAPEAAHPARRRRGHRHARVDRLARHHQQVRPHAAGHLRAEVLLQLGHLAHRRRRPGLRGGQARRSSRSSRRRTRSTRTRTRRSSSCCATRTSRSPAGRSRSTASSSASCPAASAAKFC